MRRAISAAALACAASLAVAQTPAPAPVPPPPDTPAPATTPAPARAKRPATSLRLPRGPIKITAERADLEQRETALYRGNVRLTAQGLELGGDRLELRQPAAGQFQATLTGKPARLHHAGEADVPPITASAGRIVYDTRLQVVTMTGGVQLERGADSIRGESLRYDLASRRISASGTDSRQVQIVIQPPAPAEEENRPAVPQNGAPPPGTPQE